MAFDFESGLQGGEIAGENSQGNPWAVAAGFVIGGFAGGRKKRRAKKDIRKNKRRLKKFGSTKFLQEETARGLPLFRQAIQTSGEGARIGSKIASLTSRTVGSNTGIGQALQSSAINAPELIAFQNATNQARVVQERKIKETIEELNKLGQKASSPLLPRGSTQGGSLFGDAIFGGGDKQGLGNKSFEEQFGDQDFSVFQPTAKSLGGSGDSFFKSQDPFDTGDFSTFFPSAESLGGGTVATPGFAGGRPSVRKSSGEQSVFPFKSQSSFQSIFGNEEFDPTAFGNFGVPL